MSDMSPFAVSGRLVKIARLQDEWFTDVLEPNSLIAQLKSGCAGRVDLFTFWQRPGVGSPAFSYYSEREFVAALPVTSYESWWTDQIDGKTRNLVRKGEKKGLTTEVVPFDDGLVEGITKIFNETPIRQGRPFWHYGKSFARVKVEMSDRLATSVFIGAYAGQELVGFVKLLLQREYAMMVEIISEVRSRDKAPNNSLIAAAVRECARLQIPMLTYSTWGPSSLASFKQHNGFEKLALPRYYVPLTVRGQMILLLRLHRGFRALLPEPLTDRLRSARSRFYAWSVGWRRS
jgi:hypothetical protein